MIKGETKNVAMNPVGYKSLDDEEIIVPYQKDLRNGHLTDAGNWHKRNGYAQAWDTGANSPVSLLIPEGVGYATDKSGKIFKLTATPTEYSGKRLDGDHRPHYEQYDDTIIICDGGTPIKIESNNTAALDGSPPHGRFPQRLSSYTLLLGKDNKTIYFSAPGNPENWSSGGASNFVVKLTGEKVRHFTVFNELIYLLKDKSLEVWYNRGATGATFARQEGMLIKKGCGADDSVIKANNMLYWLGDDFRFYFLAPGSITPQVISGPYENYIYDFINPGVYKSR
jgi:hypothetical protein